MEAAILAREFQVQFKQKYNYYPYSMKTVKDGKWWTYFEEFANSSSLDNEQVQEFVRLVFEGCDDQENKIYPFVLRQSIAVETEKYMINQSNAYRSDFNMTEDDYIKSTLKKIKDWALSQHIYNNMLGRFIWDQSTLNRARRGELYIPILLFSKTFTERYNPTKDELLKKNSIRAFHQDLYNALKKSLMDDFED